LTHALEYFEQIYVINLPHRHDRRREIAEQLSEIGLGFDSPGIKLFEAVRPEAADGFPSVGARGCFLSHLGVLRDACSRGLERILIIEDDLNFVPDFNTRMDKVRLALEGIDWSVFYGGYALKSFLQMDDAEIVVKVKSSELIGNTHFVAFRGGAICEAVTFLEALLSRPAGDPRGGPMHVDGAYNWFRNEFPSRITLLAVSQLGYQRSSRTDIHALRWFDRVPVVRSAVGTLRRMRSKPQV
jgi:GR25 family glycosyltransferase involved in LPS biosynthesis